MFKLKDDKSDPSYIYLGTFLEQVETQGGTKGWSMLLEQYVKSAGTDLESTLTNQDIIIPNISVPMSTGYHPSKDVSH